MKIVMVAPAIKIPEDIAQSIHQEEFINHLAKMGHEVHVICRRPGGRGGKEGSVTYHPILSYEFPFKRPFLTAHASRYLRRLLKVESFDVIHDRGYLFGAVGTKIASEKGLPSVLQIDDDWVETEALASFITGTRLYKNLAKSFCRKLMNDMQLGFTVSETLKERVVRDWGARREKLCVIPNGVDLDRFNPEAEPLGLRKQFGIKEDKLVCFVGALGPWHGVSHLIEAAPVVQKVIPNTSFLVVGSMAEYGTESYVQMAERLGVKKIFFLGRRPAREIPRILVECDVAVAPYPARDLGFSPLKIFEYMASGLPVVASDLPSLREIIEDGVSGLLVPPCDVEHLARRIIEVLSDEELSRSLSENGLRRVKNYSWRVSTEKLVKLYERAAATVR